MVTKHNVDFPIKDHKWSLVPMSLCNVSLRKVTDPYQ